MPSQTQMTPWTATFQKTHEADTRAHAKTQRARFGVVPKWQYYATQQYERQQSDGETNMRWLTETLEKIDRHGYQRSDSQRHFINHFIAASLHQIYKSDLYKDLDAIMARFNLDMVRSDVIVITPRRWGKTYSVAIYCAAYIMSQIEGKICIYSTGKRASNAMLMLIYQIVMAISGGDKSVIHTYNMVDCKLKVNNPRGSWGEVSSYPSKVDVHFFDTYHYRRDGTDGRIG